MSGGWDRFINPGRRSGPSNYNEGGSPGGWGPWICVIVLVIALLAGRFL